MQQPICQYYCKPTPLPVLKPRPLPSTFTTQHDRVNSNELFAAEQFVTSLVLLKVWQAGHTHCDHDWHVHTGTYCLLISHNKPRENNAHKPTCDSGYSTILRPTDKKDAHMSTCTQHGHNCNSIHCMHPLPTRLPTRRDARPHQVLATQQRHLYVTHRQCIWHHQGAGSQLESCLVKLHVMQWSRRRHVQTEQRAIGCADYTPLCAKQYTATQ